MPPPEPAATEIPSAPPPPAPARSAALLGLAAAGLLAPLATWWLSGRSLLHTDSESLFAPQRWLAGEALRAFRLPLWNPYAGTGLPYLGETIHGVLHPISIAVAFLFPGDRLDPLLAAYLLAAGLGALALARGVGASRPAAAAAAFAYGVFPRRSARPHPAIARSIRRRSTPARSRRPPATWASGSTPSTCSPASPRPGTRRSRTGSARISRASLDGTR